MEDTYLILILMGEQGNKPGNNLRDIYFYFHMFAHTVGREWCAVSGVLNSLSPT